MVPEETLKSRAVAEVPFWLEINGRRVGSWTSSPEQLPALATGWLLAQGYLTPTGRQPELREVEDDGIVGIQVTLPADQALQGDLERRHRREHGCGLHYFVRCAPGSIRDLSRSDALPDPELLTSQFQELFEVARSGGPGGVHAAALTDGDELFYPLQEVGRHNAVDKVIGQAILDGRPTAGLGLVLTARISGEIALKAARAGLAWVASRSVPTTLALEIAQVAGLPLLARAMGRERYLHLPGEVGEVRR